MKRTYELPGDWERDAACRHQTAVMSMPTHAGRAYSYRDRTRIATAKTVCASCPVLAECRRWALTEPDPAVWMVAAGMTPAERTVARQEGVA